MTTATATLESISDLVRSGRHDEAREALNAVSETDDNRSELMFLRGYLCELDYDREQAAAAYEQALQADPHNAQAAFRLALLADQWGDERAAMRLYEQCISHDSAHVNALLNMAVLCEERGELVRAESCLKEVLREHPSHERARRFLKSVQSSYTMIYDEHGRREHERRHALLDMPISDFELSVRARNCLRQMNIRTLGDLLRTTEYELLSYKNFGETSLNEIKAMLAQKGLRLGQAAQPQEQEAPPPVVAQSPSLGSDSAAQFHKPVSELELSVRARKALQRLGVTTLGELAMRTEAELMAIKNFGQTSMNEIKQQLAKYGMSLREPGK